jgi:hypothetical protein
VIHEAQGIPQPPAPAKPYRASGLVQPGGRRDFLYHGVPLFFNSSFVDVAE